MTTYDLLHDGVRQVLAHRLGWEDLRPVQDEAYRAINSGNDVLVIAPTAGGKTEAALIPVVDRILKEAIPGIAAVYIAPLKALINDQEDRFMAFCLPNSLELLKWHGDVPKGERIWSGGEPPHFLMITPESLEVLLMERNMSAALGEVRFIIVDELHAFIESERGVHLKVLLDRLDSLARRKIQRIGLSATVGNPEEILEWIGGNRRGQSLVRLPAAPREKRFSFVVEEQEKKRLQALTRFVSGKKALVFVNSRGDAEEINRALSGQVERLLIHHSSLSPAMRKDTEEVFSRSGSACIICTSTLELGIDIGDLDIVVQVGVPATVSSFLQRMGRAGRRGKPPYVVSILKNPYELLCTISVIESAMKGRVEPLNPPVKPYGVLVQQLLLELIRFHRRSRVSLRKFFRGLAAFSDIKGKEINLLLAFMIENNFLEADGDLLMPGQAAEKMFGRSNWKDLFSVISGPGEFRAVTPEGELVGKLDSRFVAGRSGKSFTLGGRSWTFIKSDEPHELAVVVPGEGERSDIFWTGGQSGLSMIVCLGIEEIICRGGSVLPLPSGEEELLSILIHQFPIVVPGSLQVTERPGKKGPEVMIYTFRERRWNTILSLLIKKESDRKLAVHADDLFITIKNADRRHAAESIGMILEKLRAQTIGQMGRILSVPHGISGKFSAAIPEPLLREMALADYYDFPSFFEDFTAAGLVVSKIPPE